LREQRGRTPVDERKVTHLRQLPEEIRMVTVEPDGTEESRVVPSNTAWNMAVDMELDLVLITKDAKPPVYKLCDYGKFKFAEDKHLKELAKSNREHMRTVKALRFNQNIGIADYTRNMERIKEWLPDHDVRLEVIMKGYRGMTNRQSLPRGMPQSEAPRWPEFILNRVLRDLGPTVRNDRMSVGDKGISTVLRPA
jgi:translation initiation factor IF-3